MDFAVFLLNLNSFNWWLRKGEICSLLKIFEQGKYFMKSVFTGKHAAKWLMHSVEHFVIGVKPKHFFTFRKGDTAYTVQRGSSNQFGQYLSVIELKVGGA